MGEIERTYSASELVSQRVNHLLFINGMMTRRALAFRMGLQPPTINSKVSGANRWNIDDLIDLSGIFGVSINYLIGKEPIESAVSVNAKVPASRETGTNDVVAGTGFEPVTSGL